MFKHATVESAGPKSWAPSHQVAPRVRNSRIHVFPELREAINLHIVKNLYGLQDPPLMLMIQGPSGEGKSVQALEACYDLDLVVVPLPGAALAGEFEGRSAAVISDAYIYASDKAKELNKNACLLIDDFDTSVASVDSDRRYTVNSQLLSGFLMYLCQNPYQIGNRQTNRVPVVATGNNFKNIYGPLTRRGRAAFFNWNPTFEQKCVIAERLLGPLLNPEEQRRVRELVAKYSNREGSHEPIAFYQHVRNDAYDKRILSLLEKYGQDLGKVVSDLHKERISLTLEELERIAERRHLSKPDNYLF